MILAWASPFKQYYLHLKFTYNKSIFHMCPVAILLYENNHSII